MHDEALKANKFLASTSLAKRRMKLAALQRRMARAVMTPLTPSEHMRARAPNGRSMRKEAAAFIKPNDRLTSFERLEIYNRQYWWRILFEPR